MWSRSLVLLIVLGAPSLARAQDQFEIQVYDAETASAGGFGLETHLNVVAAGTTQPSPEGEAATDHQTHVTLEPHIGVARWCELGAYIQLAFDGDGSAHWAGWKLRLKMRIPRRYAHDVIGLALNVEGSMVPARYEANVFGAEVRPIIDFVYKRYYASFNPILAIDLAGPQAGRPQLEPALKLAVAAVPNALFFGIEYYAGFGPITALLPASEQTHRLFAVVDILHNITEKLALGVNFGVGYNLTGEGDRWVVKAIIGIGR